MSNIDQDEPWQVRADMALASVMAANTLITYAELADASQISGRHRIHRLALWLEDILAADHQAGKPLRAARVISRSRGGIPAPGFFIKCQALGLYEGPVDGPKAQVFHLNLLG